MEIVSPKSPSGVRNDIEKGATVFLSHVRKQFMAEPVDYTGELVRLLDDIANFTRVVSTSVTDSALVAEYSGHHAHNSMECTAEGATQSLYRLLAHDGYCCIILSKSFAQPLTFPEGVPHGNYVVCVSPLDSDPITGLGSGAGTLFSVYKRRSSASLPGRGIDLKQKLSDQVAAGYCNYSSATTLFYSMKGMKSHVFALHPVAQQYFHETPVVLKDNPHKIFCNLGMLKDDTSVGKAVKKLLTGDKYQVSSTGCLASDVYYLFRDGGVLVAQDVHLMCEAAPIAYILEHAGGVCVDEFGDPIMKKMITEEHDVTVTMIVGTKTCVGEVVDALRAGVATIEGMNGKPAQ